MSDLVRKMKGRSSFKI
ncbi:MAG: hypothetical protein OXC62_14645 [Aestuariivita sp.]|nr:hypothetical protein [Aestuariivita sp.]MCY4305996.1 hypothetical protein [Aestuariivita sp.]